MDLVFCDISLEVTGDLFVVKLHKHNKPKIVYCHSLNLRIRAARRLGRRCCRHRTLGKF